jgi:hypothetical protein
MSVNRNSISATADWKVPSLLAAHFCAQDENKIDFLDENRITREYRLFFGRFNYCTGV